MMSSKQRSLLISGPAYLGCFSNPLTFEKTVIGEPPGSVSATVACPISVLLTFGLFRVPMMRTIVQRGYVPDDPNSGQIADSDEDISSLVGAKTYRYQGCEAG